MTQYYITVLEKRIIKKYQASLIILKDYLDNTLIEIYEKAYGYAFSENLDNLRNSKNPAMEFDKGHHYLGIKVYDLIESVFYINEKFNITIGKNELQKTDVFFSRHYPDFDPGNLVEFNYNRYYKGFPLPVDFMITNYEKAVVYPFFIYDKLEKKNKIIINVSEERICNILRQHILTPNTILFIMDLKGNIISRSRTKIRYGEIIYTPDRYPPIKDNRFIESIKKNIPFSYNLFGEKRLIIKINSGVFTENGLIYIASIPYRDLYEESMPVQNITLIISIICFIISIVISFFISKNLYLPIKNIIALFKQDKNNELLDATNEFSFINMNIKQLLNTKTELNKKLSISMPLAGEQYIFRLMNDNEPMNNEEAGFFLKENNINFKDTGFIVLMTKLIFTSQFYEKFDRERELQILNRTHRLFKNILNDQSGVYIITIMKNELCVILNIPENYSIKKIYDEVKKIHGAYKSIGSFLNIFTGIGSEYAGYNGLKRSYKEAGLAVSALSIMGNEKIKIHNNSMLSETQYDYSINDENKLMNLLISANREKSQNLITEIFRKNREHGISLNRQKELYIQIYSTCIRVLNRLDMTVSELMNEKNINLTDGYRNMDINEISGFVSGMVEKICLLCNRQKRGKIDTAEIIEFINRNYNEDISLEEIADKYGVTIFHLSRIMKKSIGMPFQEYLYSLRINKSKFLLQNTDKTIEEISTICGFNSRQTFMRMFKKLEEITPGEYRNIENRKPINPN